MPSRNAVWVNGPSTVLRLAHSSAQCARLSGSAYVHVEVVATMSVKPAERSQAGSRRPALGSPPWRCATSW